MPKVFISHSWEDNELSRKIAHYLKEDGAEIWIDYARIKPGEGMPDRIGEALEWCDTLVLVWSKNAGSSYYVKLEWQCALDMQKKIIPCIIDDTKRPPILRGFLYIDFKNFEQGYEQLLYALNLKRSKKTKPPIVPPPKIENVSAAEKPKPEKIQPKPIQKVEPPQQPFVDIQQDTPGRKKNPLKQLLLPLLAVLLVVIGIYALSNSDCENREANITPMDESVTIDSTAIVPDSTPVIVDTAAIFEPVNLDAEKEINGIKFILINGGTFNMGDSIDNVYTDEEPVHAVKVSGFYMSKTEVTVGQFRKFVEAKCYQTEAEKEGYAWTWSGWEWEWEKVDGASWRKPGFAQNDNHPVVCVSWNDATEFCKWIGCRLPTEAEWEYACRSGTTGPFNTGENLTTDQANYNGNYLYKNSPKGKYLKRTTPVGSYPPNAWGLYDMHGNVWEWCGDWHGSDYYADCNKQGTVVNPGGPTTGSYRVLRGGGWASYARYCRSAFRDDGSPDYRNSLIGFRLVFVP